MPPKRVKSTPASVPSSSAESTPVSLADKVLASFEHLKQDMKQLSKQVSGVYKLSEQILEVLLEEDEECEGDELDGLDECDDDADDAEFKQARASPTSALALARSIPHLASLPSVFSDASLSQTACPKAEAAAPQPGPPSGLQVLGVQVLG